MIKNIRYNDNIMENLFQVVGCRHKRKAKRLEVQKRFKEKQIYILRIIERIDFIKNLNQKVTSIYNLIAKNDNEKISLRYSCFLKQELTYENILALYKKNHQRDIRYMQSHLGIHKDDFIVYLNGKNVNTYGSQGQNRTVVLSLKMSELQVIKDEIGENPILLLDDFMSELDKERRKNFLENIGDTQVFVTCTDKIDVENLNSNIYNVIDGEVFLRKD